ncbi:MAG: alpha/beta hydrolase [Spiribacter salinus]|uniref:Alpha/beta hydrolase n=1 Tax=Spiribacter salinus TaxID=1335746 RepID=A0A540VU14_9GAMM|nr:MAG: alpha/beta hydrolase [Spiribacter salinus]
MEEAPYFEKVADAPPGGRACWLNASDGTRIRVVYWGGEALEGTLLLFPGRTEYAEKYGRTAKGLAERGLATLCIDWRGQGLADRLHEDEMLGHVRRFSDYQRDVRAMVEAAKTLGAPEPYYLLGHSMGGCIGLRALHEGLEVKAAAFTAPMWGIYLAPAMRPTAWALSNATSKLGIGGRLAPGTKRETYVLADPFDDNMLTTDRDMWDYMVRQAKAHPELTLGGPSLHWLAEALRETRKLHIMASPPHQAICFLGTRERIVDVSRIESRMRRWENGRLVMQEGAEHEVLMESSEMRAAILDEMVRFFFE